MARIATQLMLGKKLARPEARSARPIPHFGVKEAVFPFNMFPEVDPVLGPGDALHRRSAGHGRLVRPGLLQGPGGRRSSRCRSEGTVLITVADRDKNAAVRAPPGGSANWASGSWPPRARTRSSSEHGIADAGRPKLHEGRPNIVDAIKNGEIHLVVNTPAAQASEADDSYIRKAAIKHKIPYITTMAAAMAAAKGIAARREGDPKVRSLQQYHADIR